MTHPDVSEAYNDGYRFGALLGLLVGSTIVAATIGSGLLTNGHPVAGGILIAGAVALNGLVLIPAVVLSRPW